MTGVQGQTYTKPVKGTTINTPKAVAVVPPQFQVSAPAAGGTIVPGTVMPSLVPSTTPWHRGDPAPSLFTPSAPTMGGTLNPGAPMLPTVPGAMSSSVAPNMASILSRFKNAQFNPGGM